MLVTILAGVAFTHAAFGADIYKVDASHARVGFVVRHLVISKVRGEFRDYAAIIVFDEKDITNSSLEGVIQVASLDTGHEKRDTHLRSSDFFYAEAYPEIKFKSKHIEKTDSGYIMIGDFTMRGVTKEIAMPFSLTEPITHSNQTRFGFEATLEINRQDYGIAYNKVADTGGLVVSNKVVIEIDGEAMKQK
jgi:polyisoprenoid-binding protein YceI